MRESEIYACVEVFVSCIRDLLPEGSVSVFMRKNFNESFTELLNAPGTSISPEYFKKVCKWASRQEVYTPIFLHEKPHWEFTSNWNKIAFQYKAAHSYKNKPQGAIAHDGYIPDDHLADLKHWYEKNGEMGDYESVKSHQEMIRKDPDNTPIKNPHHLTLKAAKKMRQQMINLGMYNMDGPNAALIRAGVEPLISKDKPPSSMKDIASQIGGADTEPYEGDFPFP